MALGDYISSKAEFDLALQEQKRELWEYDNNPEGEKAEMVELLEDKGIESADAVRFIDIIAKHRDFFVDYMVGVHRPRRCDLGRTPHESSPHPSHPQMIEELGLDVPDDPWGPYKDGLVMICSYNAFGVIPLLPYAFAEAAKYDDPNALFGVSIAATILSLACLGLVQARVGRERGQLSSLLPPSACSSSSSTFRAT